MAEDDALYTSERADGNCVEMVLYRNKHGLVAAMSHDIRKKV